MDQSVKLKYQKCKAKVKTWEDEFMKNHGKIPSKDDIKNAEVSVRHAYKNYYILKLKLATQLKNSKTDVNKTSNSSTVPNEDINKDIQTNAEGKDGFVFGAGILSNGGKINSGQYSSQNSPNDLILNKVKNSLEALFSNDAVNDEKATIPKKDILPVYNSNGHLKELTSRLSALKNQISQSSETENVNEVVASTAIPANCTPANGTPTPEALGMPKNVKGVWGSHLNKSEQIKNNGITKIRERTSSFHFTEKLFSSSTFKSKRNPLKPHIPLRRSKSECFSLLSGNDSRCSSPAPSETFQDSQESLALEGNVEAPQIIDDTPTTVSAETTLFSSNKCKVVVKDSFKNRTSFPKMNRLSNETQNLNIGWLDRCTQEISSPLVDMFAPEKPVKKIENNTKEKIKEKPALQHSTTVQPVMKTITENRKTDNLNDSNNSSLQPGNINRLSVSLSQNSSFTPDISSNSVHDLDPFADEENDDVDEIVSDSDTEIQPKESVLSNLRVKRTSSEALSPPSQANKKVKSQKVPGEKLTKQEKFEKKITDGRINENFIKINIKKKVFVRGRKNTSYSKYKKMMFKKKQVDNGNFRGSGRSGKCFNCGESGHWANKCPQTGGLLPLEDADQIDDSPYLTLEEAGALAEENKPMSRFAPMAQPTAEVVEDKTALTSNAIYVLPPRNAISPVYPRPDNGDDMIDTPLEVLQVLKLFGYNSFRPGQEEAIMRILSGLSTLVMLSTGAGKSLCYQLPAYLYSKRNKDCITLVVSPLVSLMEDQVGNLPGPLMGGCLHMNQTPKQRQLVEEQLTQGQLHVLLVSPEAIVSSDRNSGVGGILQKLPTIAFACIDEAHCVSQWSHNFRPSYLMLCKVLRERLKVQTVLGLTATATGPTAVSIAKHLSIPDGRIISDMPMPLNLLLSISRDSHRDSALIKLLQGPRFSGCDSIIVYCIRREECERVAGLLRTTLQDPEKRKYESSKKRALSWNAEAYHAGLTPFRRKQVQQNFMSGKIRIVVATVAFGMGINKNNLRAVIHYNMPASFERFVQEVGRAGRDGLPAHCHLFLESKGQDLSELRRHIYADSIDRHTLRKLLLRVFKPCKCQRVAEELEKWEPTSSQTESSQSHRLSTNPKEVGSVVESIQTESSSVTSNEKSQASEAGQIQSVPVSSEQADQGRESSQIQSVSVSPKKAVQVECPGHEVALLTDETVQALDLPEENIQTLLCYLELHPRKWVELLSSAYTICKVTSYGGSGALKAAAKTCPPLAMAVAMDQKAGISHEKSTSIEFRVVDIASSIGWDSGQAKKVLKDLEWRKAGGKTFRSKLSVQLSGPGMRLRAKGCLPPEELDEALDWLTKRVEWQECSKLLQLEALFTALTSVSYEACSECMKEVDMKRVEDLKSSVETYFKADENQDDKPKLLPGVENENQVRADVCAMIGTFTDSNFTGRAIARIFHGIASPCYPAHIWGRTRFWRLHLTDNFNMLCRIATSEILRRK